eukprot:m.122426 g.122426  ORF g.122426 m.122426 type:complete len:504 (+) comp11106_c0_seq3:268-1779(+)
MMQGRNAGIIEHAGRSNAAPLRALHTTRYGSSTTAAPPMATSRRTVALLLACGLIIGLSIGIGGAMYVTSTAPDSGSDAGSLQYRQLLDMSFWSARTTMPPPTLRGERVRVGNAAVRFGVDGGAAGGGVSALVVQGSEGDDVSPDKGVTVKGGSVRVTSSGGASAQHVMSKEPLEQCPGLASLNTGNVSGDHKLNIVLLSTYPRSGNSWARTLMRTSTQIKSDLTTVKGVSLLEETGRLSRCPECEDKEYGRMYQKLGIQWVSNVKKARPLYGIKGEATDDSACSHLWTEREKNADKPWPYYPDHPPIMVKTHHPQIGDTKVESWTLDTVTRVIHIVRNPFDNIASRFLGNQRQHDARFNELVEARKKGQTTPAFSKFVNLELDRIKKFHDYWFDRRLSDAERGVPTLYIRYEVMCRDTPAVLRRMLDFSGYVELPESFACTLEEYKCHASNATTPIHLDMFTEGQIAKVLDTQARSLDSYGYTWNKETNTFDLEDRPILCEW